VVGMYEGGFPHFRAMEQLEDVEEERRLVYVAFTRAEEKLYISRPRRRFVFGDVPRHTSADASRFLDEIPPELLDGAALGAAKFRTGFAHKRHRSKPVESRADALARLGFGQSTFSTESSPSHPRPDPGALRTQTPEGPESFVSGTWVMHPKLGLGVVRSRSGSSSNIKLRILFDRGGLKTIMLRYANLEVVLQ